MKINFKLFLPLLVGVFAVSLFVQSARAAEIDFQLAAQDAVGEGNILVSGSNFSSSAIDVTPTSANPGGLFGDVFDLSFNTATNTITIDGGAEGAGSTDVFNGTITGVSVTKGLLTETVNMTATWGVLPADVLAALGAPAGSTGADIASVGFVITSSCSSATAGGCPVDSVDVSIVPVPPVPEPATLLLFGSGLLGLGGLVRRKFSA